MLTIEDLRDPKRRSGFSHVGSASAGPNGHGQVKPQWRAQAYGSQKGTLYPSSNLIWRGPSRTDPQQAAQDYCDWANGLGVTPPTTLNYPGHAVRPKVPVESEEVAAALGILRDARAQRQGRQGYVYCIGERSGGNTIMVKIGYSVNPEARVGELQTGNPRQLYLVAKMPGTEEDERRIHAKFIHKNIIGEWFYGDADVLGEFAGHYVV